MVKDCMLKTSVVEQILIYSDGHMTGLHQWVCPSASSSLSVCMCPQCVLAAHCGSAFKMAFTSSATAVRANSNWS